LVIRCERCSTLYELDEVLLAPDGSPVQCTRCEHVFTARPPRPSDSVEARSALEPASAAEAIDATSSDAAEPAAGLPSVAAYDAEGRTAPAPRPESLGPRPPAHEPRYARGAAPSVYRPTPGPGSVRTHPVLRRDTVGAFESRLRSTARLRWLAPAVALGVLVLGAGGWLFLRGRVDPAAASARAEGLRLVALDDQGSLERAVARFDDALRRAPRLRAVAADRALALVMQANALRERSRVLAAALGARQAERERLAREQPPGSAEAERAAAAAAAALDAEARALEERSRALVATAREALRPLEQELGDDPALQRALASAQAAAGERDGALGIARAAGAPGDRDPWIDLADAALDAAEPQRAAQERAAVKLAAIAARSPQILRARHLLARAQTALGRPDDARATLDRLLAANPAHEGALALRDALSQGPHTASPAEPLAGNAASPPGKTVTQRSPAAVLSEAAVRLPQAASAAGPAAVAAPRTDAPTHPLDDPPAAAVGAPASGLMPATIPDVAPASGMPQIAPPEVPERARRHSREPAVLVDPIGGG
jgi:predicted Zn finger-like uncharacterized protein